VKALVLLPICHNAFSGTGRPVLTFTDVAGRWFGRVTRSATAVNGSRA
jgi:hypothetical protein